MGAEDVVDYGPLTGLIGTWKGDKGMDVSPEPDGVEENPFYETIEFEAAGNVTNAESQSLAIVRYHQVVTRKSNDEVFHDEIGYWLWDAENQVVMHSLAIPRGVTLVAGGSYTGDANASPVELEVRAADGEEWGISQSPFMRDNARTLEFRHRVVLAGDTLNYHETTVLEIYGKRFDHTDASELIRS
jgi:hypothetical protein